MTTPKRQRTDPTRAGKNSGERILSEMKHGPVDEVKSFKALCSCVVHSASENQSEMITCLDDLLKQGANPNYDNESVLERTGGTPLHLAIKLNVPKAVEVLLNRGASLVQIYDGKTPIQVRSYLLKILV
jgi:hypothetical protein